MRRRASMWVTDDYGNKTEAGYKSEIIGVSLKIIQMQYVVKEVYLYFGKRQVRLLN